MPNWVANSVRCDNLEVLGKLRDFNRIIPMPLALEKTESGSNSGHYERLIFDGLSFRDIIQPENAPPRFLRFGQDDYGDTYNICRPMPLAEWLPLARRYHLCRSLYGYATWYDWCVEEWGTKWNCHEYRLEDSDRCTFETAWTHPGPIIEALSRQHPQLILEVSYADEDLGNNAGRYTIKNGKWFDAGAGCLTAAAKPTRLLFRCGAVRKNTAGMERNTATSISITTMTEQQIKRLRALFF